MLRRRKEGREVRRVDGNPHYRPQRGPSAATKREFKTAGQSRSYEAGSSLPREQDERMDAFIRKHGEATEGVLSHYYFRDREL